MIGLIWIKTYCTLLTIVTVVDFNLNYTQAIAVSDHYSIELNLNVQSGPASTTPTSTTPAVSIATRDRAFMYIVVIYIVVLLILL